MRQLSFGLSSSATLGFEEQLWQAANNLRNKIDPGDYKYAVLGLLFLKYISTYGNGIKVPLDASWSSIKEHSGDSKLAERIDKVFTDIESANSSLSNALPIIFSKININNEVLADLIFLIDEISFGSDSKDLFGRVYEYFMGKFASAEGNAGGEYFTPQSVVRLLVNMIEPFDGVVYDPCCGTGGMFVQSEEFIKERGGKTEDIKIYGQELNNNTWKLCKMNLKVRGLDGDIGSKNADSFHEDLHPKLKADYILANPPFNISSWGGNKLVNDLRWKYGVPPVGNANFAWVQHILHHLKESGIAGFVLSNGSLSTNHGRPEGEIRKKLIQNDLVDCIVSLPNQLFYTTQISASLWFLTKNKNQDKYRKRNGEVLFIYAQDMGKQVDRIHKELTTKEVEKIARVYHSWRNNEGKYKDVPGFCKSVSIQDIEQHKWALVPGRYVGFDDTLQKEIDLKKLREEIDNVENNVKEILTSSTKSLDLVKDIIYG